MDASFVMDVFLNFRTAFLGSDHLVTEAKAIAVHYLKVRTSSTVNCIHNHHNVHVS